MNIKKMIFPVSLALTAGGLGASLMTNPSEDNNPKTEQALIQAEEKPFTSSEAANALIAIGLGGLAYCGAKKLDELKTEAKEDNKAQKIKESPQDIKRNECIALLKEIVEKNNEKNGTSLFNTLDNLRTKIYYGKKCQVYDLLAQKEALAIIDGLISLKGTIAMHKEIQKNINMEFPKLNYLINKMYSSPEEWKTEKEKYPHYENVDSYKTYKAMGVAKNWRIAEAALENEQYAQFKAACESMKESILSRSCADNKSFHIALKDLVYFTSSEAQNKFISHNMEINVIWEELRKTLGKCTKLPETSESSSTQKSKSTQKDKPVGKTTEAQKETKVDKNNENAGNAVAINNSVNKTINFDSVGGQDEAIRELKKKVMFPLKYPDAFKNRMLDRGVVMYGKPGTGKTLLALALSNEAGVNFIKVNASDMTASVHGATEKNWRDLFEKARKNQPCILFVDEFDSIATKRGANKSVNYDDLTLNQILALMSDVEKRGDNIFIIGATNRFEELDGAAKRAGRFGTHIEVKAPETVKDVIQIFDIHTKGKKLADDINKEDIAKMLLEKNVTGADIAAIINNAIENTFIRQGIYEKMDNGTFSQNDMNDIVITFNDILNAIIDYKNS